MEGQTIKEFMRKNGVTMDALAARLGTSKQNISSALMNKDIRTGLLETVAELVGVSPAIFYGETSGSAVVNHAERSTVIGKQETGAASVAALTQQLNVKDVQIDRLLKIIENLNGI